MSEYLNRGAPDYSNPVSPGLVLKDYDPSHALTPCYVDKQMTIYSAFGVIALVALWVFGKNTSAGRLPFQGGISRIGESLTHRDGVLCFCGNDSGRASVRLLGLRRVLRSLDRCPSGPLLACLRGTRRFVRDLI